MDINVDALALTRIGRILSYASNTVYSPMCIFVVRRVLLACDLVLVALHQVLLVV